MDKEDTFLGGQYVCANCGETYLDTEVHVCKPKPDENVVEFPYCRAEVSETHELRLLGEINALLTKYMSDTRRMVSVPGALGVLKIAADALRDNWLMQMIGAADDGEDE